MQKHCTHMSFAYHLHTFCILDAHLLRSVCMFFGKRLRIFGICFVQHVFFDFEYVCSHPFFGDKLNQYRGSGPAFEHRTLSTATLWPRVEGLGGNPQGASDVCESYVLSLLHTQFAQIALSPMWSDCSINPLLSSCLWQFRLRTNIYRKLNCSWRTITKWNVPLRVIELVPLRLRAIGPTKLSSIVLAVIAPRLSSLQAIVFG